MASESAIEQATLVPHREPSIRTYLDYAFLFGMRDGSTALESFLFSHYGNWSFRKSFYDEVWDPFDFFPGPRLRQAIKAGILEADGHDLWQERAFGPSDFAEFMSASVALRRFIYLVLDEFYIPAKESFRSRHFIHHSLVAGWDPLRRMAGLLGYFRLPDSDYGMQWVRHDRLWSAFNFNAPSLDGPMQETFCVWNHRYIETFRVAPEARFDFRFAGLIAQLKDYLNSTGESAHLTQHNKAIAPATTDFGLAVYDRLDELVDRMESGRLNTGFHPTRMFSEHKSFMLERAIFLRDQSVPIAEAVLDQLREVVKLAREIRFFMIAASETRSRDAFNAIRGRFHQCRNIEQRCYPLLIRSLLLFA